jgi:hypothetical protein
MSKLSKGEKNLYKQNLIEFVRKHEYLYDSKHPSYKDNGIKNDRFTEFGNSYNKSGNFIKFINNNFIQYFF